MAQENKLATLPNIIHQCDLIEAVAMVLENNIHHVLVKENEHVTMETIYRGQKFINSIGGGPFYTLFEFEVFSDVSPEVRNWAAKPDEHRNTLADALVIKSFSQKILADFYLRFNRPKNPTKVFNNRENALVWLESLKTESARYKP